VRGADHAVDRHQRERCNDERDRQFDRRLAEPGGEALVRQAVLVLAHEVGIDGKRRAEPREGQHDAQRVEPDLQRPRAHAALGRVAQTARHAAGQQEHRAGHRNDRAPQCDPVATFEIGVGLRALRRVLGRDPGVGRRHRVERHGLRRRRDRGRRRDSAGRGEPKAQPDRHPPSPHRSLLADGCPVRPPTRITDELLHCDNASLATGRETPLSQLDS